MNQQHPQNLVINDNSLKHSRSKAIGGLLSTKVQGTFIHTNTIEEYNAYDLERTIEVESSKILQDDFENANRFVVVSFGDLKNYFYHYK